MVWILFVILLIPAAVTGYVVGHYTSLGKSASTVVHTVTLGGAVTSTGSSVAIDVTNMASTDLVICVPQRDCVDEAIDT